jgi:hypothetical protein
MTLTYRVASPRHQVGKRQARYSAGSRDFRLPQNAEHLFARAAMRRENAFTLLDAANRDHGSLKSPPKWGCEAMSRPLN